MVEYIDKAWKDRPALLPSDPCQTARWILTATPASWWFLSFGAHSLFHLPQIFLFSITLCTHSWLQFSEDTKAWSGKGARAGLGGRKWRVDINAERTGSWVGRHAILRGRSPGARRCSPHPSLRLAPYERDLRRFLHRNPSARSSLDGPRGAVRDDGECVLVPSWPRGGPWPYGYAMKLKEKGDEIVPVVAMAWRDFLSLLALILRLRVFDCLVEDRLASKPLPLLQLSE